MRWAPVTSSRPPARSRRRSLQHTERLRPPVLQREIQLQRLPQLCGALLLFPAGRHRPAARRMEFLADFRLRQRLPGRVQHGERRLRKLRRMQHQLHGSQENCIIAKNLHYSGTEKQASGTACGYGGAGYNVFSNPDATCPVNGGHIRRPGPQPDPRLRWTNRRRRPAERPAVLEPGSGHHQERQNQGEAQRLLVL